MGCRRKVSTKTAIQLYSPTRTLTHSGYKVNGLDRGWGSRDSNNRKGRKMMMEWNRVVAIGIKKMGRKYVERIGKIFGDRFMGDK